MKIIGHRGGKNEWPENTMLGFVKAIEAGVSGIELDIHKSLDGKLMVIHDATLDRTTNSKGKVSEKRSDELRKLDAGSGEKIPFLEEVIELIQKTKTHLYIEAKVSNIVSELACFIKEHNAYDICTVISFDHYFVKELKHTDSKIQTGCTIAGIPVDVESIVRSANADCFTTSIGTLRPELALQCKNAGIPLAIWNANTEQELLHMKDLGIELVMTDCPTKIVPLI